MGKQRDLIIERHDDIILTYMDESVAMFNPNEAEHAVTQLTKCMETEGVNILIVDMSKIEKCGTLLLTVLVRLHIRAKKRDKILRLCEISHFVHDSIKITGLEKLFRIFDYREDAIAGANAE